MKPINYPKLRWPIDIKFEQIDDQHVLVLRCPIGVSPGPLGLSPAVAPILSVFEGHTSREGVLSQFADRGLTPELLDQLLTVLDENFFLATPRFFAEERRLKDAFAESSIRPAAFAGRTYSQDPEELAKEIDGYMSGFSVDSSKEQMIATMAPHIDYRRGHLCYGNTYARIKERLQDLIIVIGTSHQYSTGLFHLTAKDFASPLGTIRSDTGFISKLAGRYGVKRAFHDEYLHKSEHSLELQIPFLAKICPGATIVPILVGSFHRMLSDGRYPDETAEYDDFIEALAECIKVARAEGRNVTFLAGVDMAHIGRAFGDEGGLNPTIMEDVARKDREYIRAIEMQDKRGLFDHIALDQDARRMCGFPTMYSMIDAFDRIGTKYRSELVEYRQAVDYRTDCAVTFAGMTFSELSSRLI